MQDPDLLNSFVNGALRSRLSRRGVATSWTSEPVQAALLYLDISGFTRVGEELATEGPRAADRLMALLNAIFQPIIDDVHNHWAGEVLGFSGDSITALWSAEQPEALAQATIRAARCGLLLAKNVPQLEPMIRHGLDVRMGVTCGAGRFLEVGGHLDRWVFLLGGDPTSQIPGTINAAKPREVVASPQAWALLAAHARGEPRGVNVTIHAVDPPPPVPVPADRPSVGASAAAYLPEPVLHRVETGDWLAELRLITSVFVNLRELNIEREDDGRALNRAVSAWQEELDRFEGCLDKVSIDDKGATMIGTFGLPPRAHEDDAVRATGAALAIASRLLNTRQEFGIGVATGRAFCGAYGSDAFRQYTTIGSVMNRAAGLMQASHNEVLVDSDSVSAAQTRVKFSRRPDVVTKAGPHTTAWRPLWQTTAAEAVLDHETVATTIGRERELALLDQLIADVGRSGRSRLVTIIGEPGIGKTRLLREAITRGEDAGLRPLVGAGDPILRNSPYSGWRMIVRDLLDLGAAASQAERREAAHAFLATLGGMNEMSPALDPLLDLGLEDSPATVRLAATARKQAVSSAVLALLRRAAHKAPLLLIFDDTHWLDAASLSLLREAVAGVQPVLTVTASRDESPAPGITWTQVEPPVVWRPASLSDRQAAQLAARELGVDELPDEVADAIADKAGGNPLLTEQLAIAIRDSRTAAGEWPADIRLTNSVHGLVASRLDRLTPTAELTLKTASTLGRTFSPESVAVALGATAPGGGLGDTLAELVSAELFTARGDGTYSFRHALIQEAVYDMIPDALRRTIHATMFDALSDAGSRQHAMLAYHALRAGKLLEAIHHLELAGEDALDRGASREAISLFQQALEVADPAVEPHRRGYWHAQLGIALMDTGELERALTHHQTALRELRVRTPRRSAAVGIRVVWELCVQVLHYMTGRTARRTRVSPSKDTARLALAARICSLVGEVYYFSVDSLRFTLFNLLSINLAERGGRPAAAGLAYSSLSYGARLMRLRRAAETYNLAARTAEELKADSRGTGDEWRQSAALPPHDVAAANSRGSYQLCFGEWKEAMASFAEAEQNCRLRRDDYTMEIVRALRGQALMMSRHLGEACQEYRLLRVSAERRRNIEHTAWAVALGTPLLYETGDDQTATAWANEANSLVRTADQATVPILHAARAQALIRAGDSRSAMAAAVDSLNGIALSPIFPQLVAYTGALSVIYRLWDEEPSLITGRVKRAAFRAILKLRIFGIILPYARPRVAIMRGHARLVRDRRRKALRIVRRGIDRAQRWGERWDEASLWELQAKLTRDPTECDAAARHAARIYRELGATASATRIGATLSQA